MKTNIFDENKYIMMVEFMYNDDNDNYDDDDI